MKKVIVSGGSRGIGAECVRLFASRGADVAFFYKSSDVAAKKLAQETGAFPISADVADPDSLCSAMKTAAMHLGGADVVISCAGIALIKQICDTDESDWQRIIGTNLSGTFYLCREASKLMVSQHFGRIITVGSVWGRCGASCEAAYSASKAGIRGLTKALAKELAPSGITVNCIEPGVIDTDMNAALGGEVLSELCEEIPMCRLGKAEEVAALAQFLATDEASYITGQCIGVDGGFCL